MDEIPEETPKVSCEVYDEECRNLHCPYGVARSYDSSGCERCECENPCRDYHCESHQECAIDIQSHAEYGSQFVPVCRETVKPGRCPEVRNDTRCDDEQGVECYSDANCRGDKKCCVDGCTYVCMSPEYEHRPRPPTRRPHTGAAPPVLGHAPQEEIEKEATEGGHAVLRCFATGFPPPTVTWMKDAVIVS